MAHRAELEKLRAQTEHNFVRQQLAQLQQQMLGRRAPAVLASSPPSAGPGFAGANWVEASGILAEDEDEDAAATRPESGATAVFTDQQQQTVQKLEQPKVGSPRARTIPQTKATTSAPQPNMPNTPNKHKPKPLPRRVSSAAPASTTGKVPLPDGSATHFFIRFVPFAG